MPAAEEAREREALDPDLEKLALKKERPISINVIDLNARGEVELMFSEPLRRISAYGYNLASINHIRNEVLFVDYRCQYDESQEAEHIPELIDWKFLSFDERDLTIKLTYSHPLYVSTFEEKDRLDIHVLRPELFVADKDLFQLEENYTIVN